MSFHADHKFCSLLVTFHAVVLLSGSSYLCYTLKCFTLTVNQVTSFLLRTCIREVGIRKPQVSKYIEIVASLLTIVGEFKFLPIDSVHAQICQM